ncbi:NAD(P)/FAD-dependent oxidoreductase [Jatrophihabitans fulvus]
MSPSAASTVDRVLGSGWVARPTELAPSVSGEVRCDVVVVGGGLGGMAAALRLAETGKDVVLVDQDVCGWAASARNAGYVTNTLGSDQRILERFYRDRLASLYRFANNAVSFTEKLIADQGLDCGYHATGNVAAAPTASAFASMRSTMRSSRRSVVGDAQTLGIPPAFHGGVHIKIGGVLDPGRFALGMRDRVRASPARVFEQSRVLHVEDAGERVRVDCAGGSVIARRAIVTTNAHTRELGIVSRHLATPVWVTAVETEAVSPADLDAAGWTSRAPITTNHLIMQSFRTTDRGTIVFTTRRLQMPSRIVDRLPDVSVVDDLVRGFRERFPTLGHVGPARAWGGWIGVTPSNMAAVGRVGENVYYSLACNGHGLPQAPYLGTLLADHVAGVEMPDDLAAVWRRSPRAAPGVVNPMTLRLGWVADRVRDRCDQSRRPIS